MNFYELLGIERTASREIIRAAYLRLAQEFHPDRRVGENSDEVRDHFKRIQEAYDELYDPEKRLAYDRFNGVVPQPRQGEPGTVQPIYAAYGQPGGTEQQFAQHTAYARKTRRANGRTRRRASTASTKRFRLAFLGAIVVLAIIALPALRARIDEDLDSLPTMMMELNVEESNTPSTRSLLKGPVNNAEDMQRVLGELKEMKNGQELPSDASKHREAPGKKHLSRGHRETRRRRQESSNSFTTELLNLDLESDSSSYEAVIAEDLSGLGLDRYDLPPNEAMHVTPSPDFLEETSSPGSSSTEFRLPDEYNMRIPMRYPPAPGFDSRSLIGNSIPPQLQSGASTNGTGGPVHSTARSAGRIGNMRYGQQYVEPRIATTGNSSDIESPVDGHPLWDSGGYLSTTDTSTRPPSFDVPHSGLTGGSTYDRAPPSWQQIESYYKSPALPKFETMETYGNPHAQFGDER